MVGTDSAGLGPPWAGLLASSGRPVLGGAWRRWVVLGLGVLSWRVRAPV